MKKNYLFLALVLSLNCFAQTKKNNWVIGASSNLGFNNMEYDYMESSKTSTKNNQFGIDVSGGYFVMNNLAVGLDLNYENSTRKFKSVYSSWEGEVVLSSKVKSQSMALLPTVSYYFANDTKFYPYLSAGAGFRNSKQKHYSSSENNSLSEVDFNAFIWNAKVGVSYLISKEVALNLGLTYNQTKYNEDNGSDKINDLGVNIGFKLFL